MMNYEEGQTLLEEKFGNDKDNLISLATIARNCGENGLPRPMVRDVDAYYENGVFMYRPMKAPTKSSKSKKIPKFLSQSVANGLPLMASEKI